MLIGKWNLQQQKVLQYIDGVKKVDTTYLTAPNNVSNLQFNTDNTYTSNSFFHIADGLGPYSSSGTAGGTYSYSATLFTMSGGIAGFGNVTATFLAGPAPVFHQDSHLEKVNQLTASLLNLHTESVVTATTTAGTQTVRYVNDYVYTK